MPTKLKWDGKRFGMWTVLHLEGSTTKKAVCKCDCGRIKSVWTCSLPCGASVSCGCDRDKKTVARSFRHGGASRKGHSPEYKAWRDMMKRCYQKNFKTYKDYGGRGISVCEEWQTASGFLRDIPKKPKGRYSLGRIDNNGNYEPGNVRWETDSQQQRNTRRNRYLTFNGKTACLTELSESFGLIEHVVRKRLKRGWSIERALTT